MRILAFNGSHDSSVCCYSERGIEFFCKEERLSRTKRDSLPFLSLEKFFEINSNPIDKILFHTPSNYERDAEYVFERYIHKKIKKNIINYSNMTHHLCHASLAFYSSGFEKCLVFVVDRNGSIIFNNNNPVARESESVYLCDYENMLSPLYKSFWTYSNYQNFRHVVNNNIKSNFNCDIKIHGNCGIVKVYEAATTLIGQSPLENGKTMGLSSYGDEINEKLFLDGSPLMNYFSEIKFIDTPDDHTNICFANLESIITDKITKKNYKFYANKAKQVQLQTQHEVMELIEKYVNKTKIKNVCIVGGYGLNVVANNFYLKKRPDINYYFEPISDDTGISIGAAMLQYRTLSKDKKIIPIESNNFHFYENYKIDGGVVCDEEKLCDLLIEQKSIAIFDGNPESGPRALGNRSILFDPRNIDAKNIVNKIKKREWYRPFAGIILKEYFSEYFETCGLEESKYMTINFDCLLPNKIPGVVHVDNTCRIQTVSSDNNFLYTLLKCFFNKTGCPVLLNTSFNLAGEPLVQTKKEAIDVLNNSDLDAVYFVDQLNIFMKDIF